MDSAGLKAELKNRKLSYIRLAEMADVSPTMINNYVNGYTSSPPVHDFLLKMGIPKDLLQRRKQLQQGTVRRQGRKLYIPSNYEREPFCAHYDICLADAAYKNTAFNCRGCRKKRKEGHVNQLFRSDLPPHRDNQGGSVNHQLHQQTEQRRAGAADCR